MPNSNLLPVPIPPEETVRERGLHEAFYISILLKGLNAILEVIIGIILLFTARQADLILALIENELLEDPGDFLARHINTIQHYLDPKVQLFGALYLISHGLVKGVIVAGLLKEKQWAYPAGLAVFALFIIYQTLKWSQTHSLPLLLLTIFDLFVVALIYHEYRTHSRSKRDAEV